MNKLFKINLVLFSITAALYLIVYLGMLFSMVLGAAQILMSLVILYYFKTLSKTTKILFAFYLILAASVLSLVYLNSVFDNVLLYFGLPMLTALFHLYITYRIKIER
ncbi:hypothetical protein [Winogradskyella jejuensis]|uniref:Uncharacterized protein n=1 Tax=Winogradskyella jejuensis TaxID=1089305 RepID=A0A1M5RJ80_9FLAO|nr:hypothetical protein [Winogradskyella jejuensis]SHH26139.1 hypothetical protein SAMN05444148_1600 [Winogradskyella jejuensis]